VFGVAVVAAAGDVPNVGAVVVDGGGVAAAVVAAAGGC